jgi:ribosome biogenesis protein SSF1/2
LNNKKTDLSKFNSISDYILKQSGFTSGSDNDDPNLGVVEVIKDEEMKIDEEEENGETKKEESKSNKKSENDDNRVKVKLIELGPRIDMSVKKIEEGFLKGNVVYHSAIKKSKKEIREIMEKLKLKNKLKKQRKQDQEKNIEDKKQKELDKLTEEEREELRLSKIIIYQFY